MDVLDFIPKQNKDKTGITASWCHTLPMEGIWMKNRLYLARDMGGDCSSLGAWPVTVLHTHRVALRLGSVSHGHSHFCLQHSDYVTWIFAWTLNLIGSNVLTTFDKFCCIIIWLECIWTVNLNVSNVLMFFSSKVRFYNHMTIIHASIIIVSMCLQLLKTSFSLVV